VPSIAGGLATAVDLVSVTVASNDPGFDADGSGSGAAVQIASLATRLALGAADFVVIA
jgi:hypothetical protein